jgi:hypothetical protein
VTEESFREWKRKRIEIQQNELEKLRLEKQELLKKKSGSIDSWKGTRGMRITGRDLFEYNPSWEDEMDGDVVEMVAEDQYEEENPEPNNNEEYDGQEEKENVDDGIETLTLDE